MIRTYYFFRSPPAVFESVGICIQLCPIFLHYPFKFESGGFRLHMKPSVKEQASYRPGLEIGSGDRRSDPEIGDWIRRSEIGSGDRRSDPVSRSNAEHKKTVGNAANWNSTSIQQEVDSWLSFHSCKKTTILNACITKSTGTLNNMKTFTIFLKSIKCVCKESAQICYYIPVCIFNSLGAAERSVGTALQGRRNSRNLPIIVSEHLCFPSEYQLGK